MGTKYTSQATSGYNASPPSDDGSQTAANLITWAGIKTKLGDVLKTFAEAINTQLVAVLNTSCRAISSDDSAVAGDHWRTLEVTASTTVTLPDAATVGVGWMTDVFNDNNVSAVTVALATAGNTINNVSASVSIPPLSSWTFKVNSGANGYNVVAKSQGQILMAEAPTTSGTAVTFTGIPLGVKRVTVLFNEVSTNGTGELWLQIGDSGGVEATGYSSRAADVESGGQTRTTAFILNPISVAADTYKGAIVLNLQNASTNTWTCTGSLFGGAVLSVTAGIKSLSASLDRVSLTTETGDTFDAGTISVVYEL